MIKVLIDIFGAGFGFVIAMLFYDTIWARKTVSRMTFILGLFLVAISNATVIMLFPNSIVQLVTSLLTVFALSFYFISRNYQKVLFSFVVSAIFILSEVIVSIFSLQLPDIHVQQGQLNTVNYAMGMLVSKLFALLLVYVIRLIYGKDKLAVDKQSSLLMVFMPVQSMILSTIVYGNYAGVEFLYSPFLGVFAIICSLVLVLVTMNMQKRLMKAMAYKKDYEAAQNWVAMQMNHNEKLQKAQREVMAVQHEISNNLLAISGLLTNGSVDEAISRIQGINDNALKPSAITTTGHPSIDAVIAAKIEKACEHDIHIDYKVLIDGELHIDQYDFAVVVASALDNAIEGILRADVDDKTVVLRISCNNDYIVTFVENPALPPLDGNFRTSKADKSNHGFGMAHMRTVANRYNGSVEPNFDDESGKFALRVLLRNTPD